MLSLNQNIERIEKLLAEGSASSLTYAALECRLALEKLCYERLKIAHDYVSPKDIKKWQPKDVIKFLIEEVNPLAATTLTLEMSTKPNPKQGKAPTQEEYQSFEYVELGRQAGFDPNKIGKQWHAISNFLHVKMPKTKTDQINGYGDTTELRKKIEEVLEELKNQAEGTLVLSGFGTTISFQCNCGTENKRRADLLKNGQIYSCYNVDCDETWAAHIEKEECIFQRQTVSVDCDSCKKPYVWSEKKMLNLNLNRVAFFRCECGETNHVCWKLMRLKKQQIA